MRLRRGWETRTSMPSNPFTRQRYRGNRMTGGKATFEPPAPSRSVIPQGPKILSADINAAIRTEGPGDPPAGFIGGTNSVSEWYIYWALEKLLGPEGQYWTYQSSYLGGRHIRGGAVVDFVVFTPRYNIGLRIQTFYFHLAAGSYKQADDYTQRTNLESYGLKIIDIYEQTYIGDTTGKAALYVTQLALQGIELPNPRAYGIVKEQ